MPFDTIVKLLYASLRSEVGQSHWVPPCTLYPCTHVPGRPHRVAPTLIPQINEHVQVEALLTVVDCCMGATAVYRYIMTMGTVAVDADAGGGYTDYAGMTARNGCKLTET